MATLETTQQHASFNYLAVIGNSGTGKTTYVKTLLNSLQWDKLYLCDPNRQYADYTVNDNAVYISPSELKNSLNLIGKKLVLQGKTGVLIIEDLGLTLDRICEVLQIPLSRAKKLIGLLLDNFRKYGVKVIVIAQDVDKDLIGKFDTKVFFQTPLNNYSVKKYSKLFGCDLSEVPNLAKFSYVLKNGGELEHNRVKPLTSHAAIEKDKSFMVNELLTQCNSLPQKVLVLRLHVGLTNPEIADKLNVQTNTIEVIISRLRKRGIAISDARRSFKLENLAF